MSEYQLSPNEHNIRTAASLGVKPRAGETISQLNKRVTAKAAGRGFVVIGAGLRAGSLVLSPNEVREVQANLDRAHAQLREELAATRGETHDDAA